MSSSSMGTTEGVLMQWNNDDFRERVGILTLTLVSCVCTVYLMSALESILRPLLWAMFLVMMLSPAVTTVEFGLLRVAALLCRCSNAFCHCCLRLSGCILPANWRRERKLVSNRAAQIDIDMPAPTVIGRSNFETTRFCSETQNEQMWGPRANLVAHVVAIAIMVIVVVSVLAGFVIMVVQSVIRIQDHWAVYEKGAYNFAESVQDFTTRLTGGLPRTIADEITAKGLEFTEAMLSGIITEVFSHIGRVVFEFLIMTLYIAFWLASPMPMGSAMEDLFRRYIILKGLACLGYGTCVGIFLRILKVDLAAAFGLAAFCLSFIPEIGAFAAVILPLPVILFDSRLKSPLLTLLIATSGQLGLKFVFSNVVEVKLVEADRIMKMHPVIILLAVSFFGYIWGPTGMLLSVPLVAYMKVSLLTYKVPARYRDPVLILLEGDRKAPQRYAKQEQEADEARQAYQAQQTSKREDPNECATILLERAA